MSATKQFLRAHLNAEREPLLLPAAPPRVEIEWSMQEVLNAIIDGFEKALEFFNRLEEYQPISDQVLATAQASMLLYAELASWGVPLRLAERIATRLPGAIVRRLAEVMRYG